MLSTKTGVGDISSEAKENGKHAPANFARHDEEMNTYCGTHYFATLQFVMYRYYVYARFCVRIKKS